MQKRLVVRLAVGVLVLCVVLLSGWAILPKLSPNQAFSFVPRVLSGRAYQQIGPLISRNVPAFASSSTHAASNANANTYDTAWRSQGAPAWLGYDLSRVSVAQ